MICLYIKIPEQFVPLIHLDEFWVGYIWLVHIVKLHNSLWITIPTQSCRVLNPFCVNLLHSLFMSLLITYICYFVAFYLFLLERSCFLWRCFRLVLSRNSGGARGVMVIIVENGHDDTSSNPGRDWLHFT